MNHHEAAKRCKFKMEDIGDGNRRITIEMYSPAATEVDLTGYDAAKRLAKFVFANASGFAAMVGADISEGMYGINGLVAAVMDGEAKNGGAG